jgi:hypothetical protein
VLPTELILRCQQEPAQHRQEASQSTFPKLSPSFPFRLTRASPAQNSTAKVDAILAENPGKSLDELIADKKINTDQKAQALKKPTLQANVAQIEEQIAHFKEFAQHYEDRLANQKSAMEKAHKEELNAFREKAVAEATKTRQKEFGDRLLALSRFLCTAAVMRQSGNETSGESRAFEGVLFQVYGGSQEAVASMSKLIDGADEKVPSVEGGPLEFTCEEPVICQSIRLLTLSRWQREAGGRRVYQDRRGSRSSRARFGPYSSQCSLH